jgi:hypothetical protein
MIKQVFQIEHYWRVVVYYNIDCNSFSIVDKDLDSIGISKATINKIHKALRTKYAKAFTISNPKYKTTITGFAIHKDSNDYINSIVHEAEHIKQHILQYYKVKDTGERPAYTIGYIVMKMFDVFYNLL